MDTQNHYYGHAAILSLACGSARVRHIHGLVQHGWSFNNPVLSMFHDFNVKKTSLFTWTSSARNWKIHGPNIHAIGAPWLYLTHGEKLSVSEPLDIPLFMPRHGTRISGAGVDHKALASDYADTYGTGRVLLHADDAHDKETVSAWLSAGHQVGFSKERFDPDFLLSTWEELSRAQVVISDGLSTSLIYAASLGLEIEISKFDTAKPWLAKYDGQLRDVFPEFHSPSKQIDLRSLAMNELGQSDFRPVEELKELLFLDSSVSVAAASSYWFYSPIRKVLAVLSNESAAESALAESHWTDWLKRPLENLPRRLPRLKRSSLARHLSNQSN